MISLAALFVVFVLLPESVGVDPSMVSVMFDEMEEEGEEEEENAPPKFSSLPKEEHHSQETVSTQLE
jgi:hypothetical protein